MAGTSNYLYICLYDNRTVNIFRYKTHLYFYNHGSTARMYQYSVHYCALYSMHSAHSPLTDVHAAFGCLNAELTSLTLSQNITKMAMF